MDEHFSDLLKIFFQSTANRDHPARNRNCPARNRNSLPQISSRAVSISGRVISISGRAVSISSRAVSISSRAVSICSRPVLIFSREVSISGRLENQVALSAVLEPKASRNIERRSMLCIRKFPKKIKVPRHFQHKWH